MSPMKKVVPAANPDAYVAALAGWRHALVAITESGNGCRSPGFGSWNLTVQWRLFIEHHGIFGCHLA